LRVARSGEDSAVVLNRVREGKGTFGYNAASGEYGDGSKWVSWIRGRVTGSRNRPLCGIAYLCAEHKLHTQ
jgi:hypothetical protein